MKARLDVHLLRTGCVVLVTASTMAIHAGKADTFFPPPTGQIQAVVQADDQNQQTPQNPLPLQVVSDQPCAIPHMCGAIAAAVVENGDDPSVTATSITTATSNFNQAIANMTYFFQVTGPTNTSVSLFIH